MKINLKSNIVENSENLSNLRYAVDRPEDLELVKIIISKIKKRPILVKDIVESFQFRTRINQIKSKCE